jgi:hypothetical protein
MKPEIWDWLQNNYKTHDDFTALDLASTRKILKLLSKLVKSGDLNGSIAR